MSNDESKPADREFGEPIDPGEAMPDTRSIPGYFGSHLAGLLSMQRVN